MAVLWLKDLLFGVFSLRVILTSSFVRAPPPSERFRGISLLAETSFHLRRGPPGGRGGVDYRGGGANPLPAGWKSRGVKIFSGGAGETQHQVQLRLSPPLLFLLPLRPSLQPGEPRCAPVGKSFISAFAREKWLDRTQPDHRSDGWL